MNLRPSAYLHATKPDTDQGRPRKTYGEGRICRVEGCTTHVSRYNPSGCCYLHAEYAPEIEGPGTTNRTKRCAGCGKYRDKETFDPSTRSRDGLKERCRPCERKRDAALLAARGMKRCRSCGKAKPADLKHFDKAHKSKTRQDPLTATCTECLAAKWKESQCSKIKPSSSASAT